MQIKQGSLSGSKFPEIIVPGWFHSHKLYEWVVDRCDNDSTLVECGCYFGESTVYMSKLLEEKNAIAKFHSFDILDSYFMLDEDDQWYEDPSKDEEHAIVTHFYGNNMELIVRHYLSKYGVEDRVKLVREDSIHAADRFEEGSVDFVYLDTEHSYTRVSREIKVWQPKIKPGGIIGGDDMHRDDGEDGGVKRAVQEAFNGDYVTDGITWYVQVGGD